MEPVTLNVRTSIYDWFSATDALSNVVKDYESVCGI